MEKQTRALGRFLRVLRERQIPSKYALAEGRRRRTPGLRREEVAQLCGLSTTWYTWIEQGRDVSVSPATLDRLSRGLHLSRAERSYLFELAGKHNPEKGLDTTDEIPAAVLACVDSIDGPAYILDRHWTARRWNAAAAHLFSGWLDSGGELNLLRFLFLRPEARSLICDWDARAHRVVAEFRAATTSYVDDQALERLVEDLRRESVDFARCWDTHGVLAREGGLRTFNHPVKGAMSYQQISLTLAGWPDFRLTMLLASAV